MNASSRDWHPSPQSVPVCLSGELSFDASPAGQARKGRRAERLPVELGAGLRRRGGSRVTVQVLDLSTNGFRVAAQLGLCNGADVWLWLPGLEPWHARVVWTESEIVGCEFERPLHPAVLEMVVGKASRR